MRRVLNLFRKSSVEAEAVAPAESEAERMWREWGYEPIVLPPHVELRSSAISSEFKRWRESHVSWQIIRAVNAVLDRYATHVKE